MLQLHLGELPLEFCVPVQDAWRRGAALRCTVFALRRCLCGLETILAGFGLQNQVLENVALQLDGYYLLLIALWLVYHVDDAGVLTRDEKQVNLHCWW